MRESWSMARWACSGVLPFAAFAEVGVQFDNLAPEAVQQRGEQVACRRVVEIDHDLRSGPAQDVPVERPEKSLPVVIVECGEFPRCRPGPSSAPGGSFP